MEWSAKVEELLQKNLSLGVELRNFKVTSEERLRQVSLQLDQKLDASSNELKYLQEDSDGLVAKAMCFNEEVQISEEAQKTQFSQVDEKIEKEGLAVAQMGGSLTRLRDALMIKNDPDRQFLTPPVTFTLDNFHERKDNNEFWLSPYFYSHKYGYKMQLKVFPNGTGEGAGTHISMFALVVTGEFDKLLTWPSCGSITIHLVNQRKNGRNEVHMGWGTFKLISHAELGEEAGFLTERAHPGSEYLKNNCLSFHVWNIATFTISMIK